MKSHLKSDPDAAKRYPKPAFFGRSSQSAKSSPNSPKPSNKKPADSKIILPARVYDEMMSTREKLLSGESVSRPELRRFLRTLRFKDKGINMAAIRKFINEHRLVREEQENTSKSMLVTGSQAAPIGNPKQDGILGQEAAQEQATTSEPESLSTEEDPLNPNSIPTSARPSTVSSKTKPTSTKSTAGKTKAVKSDPKSSAIGSSTKSSSSPSSATKPKTSAAEKKPRERKESEISSPVEP